MKIGILYICTGPYKLFWQGFYESSQKFLLPDFEKHYFVFTDDITFFQSYDKNYVHCAKIEHLPWPLITLFRFRYFLSQKEELLKMDYLMFSNSNMKFVDTVNENDFLPRKEQNEELFVVEHPGYIFSKRTQKPFDRSKKSLASVPYNSKSPYVIGAMNGGTSKAFINMAEQLNERTENDLKHNVIAKWHDESHLNKYVSTHSNIRILSPSYCYPYGFDLPFDKKIIAVGKQEVFDVKNFKGQIVVKKEKILKKVFKYSINCLKVFLEVFYSNIFHEKNIW